MPLPPDDLAAAVAAMRREWAEVCAHQPLANPGLPEEDRYEAAMRQMAIYRAFLDRHRAVFAAPDLAEQDLEPQKAARRLQLFLDWCEQEERREEKLLQENADLADGCHDLVLELLNQLARLESMSQEEWDALPLETRLKLNALLEALRPSRLSMLGTLPIALRREWERRLG
jgi:sugar phosphate isomerase/epimerase